MASTVACRLNSFVCVRQTWGVKQHVNGLCADYPHPSGVTGRAVFHASAPLGQGSRMHRRAVVETK